MITVAIIFGGCSTEHGVSLQSAYSVIENIDKNKYNIMLLGITEDGKWFRYYGDTKNIKDGTWCNPKLCNRAIISPDREVHGILELCDDGIKSVRLDAVFPVMHGKNGEDGTIQGLLELAGISVVGCGILSSAICMDKDRAHKLVHVAGINVPKSYVLTKMSKKENILKNAKMLGYPLYIKPVKAGSSFGITRVSKQEELSDAIDLAFKYDNEVILEENISGFEVGCAVLGNEKEITGEIDEIELSRGFFDYTEKYNLITSQIHVPARISEEKAEQIKQTAIKIYNVLGCQGFARVDMFLTPSGEIIFNEVNTIPGFTEHSRYPNMMKAAGIDFSEVISSIIDLAVKR